MMADLLANRMQQQESLGFIFLFWLLNFLVWLLNFLVSSAEKSFSLFS